MYNTKVYNAEGTYNEWILPLYHVLLAGHYLTETPPVNRAYVVGEDDQGVPVFAISTNTTEIGLVGERLDLVHEKSLKTATDCGEMADAVVELARLTEPVGHIVTLPNCGIELWDVISLYDFQCGQAGQWRVLGINLEFSKLDGTWAQTITLGGY